MKNSIMEKINLKQKKEKSPVELFAYRYLPYWPLFIILVVIAVGVSLFYLKYFATPAYEVSAKIMVDDEKKGAEESKMLEALNISSNTIVDNEIEVVQSKQLLREVTDSLHLNTPVYKKGTFTAYAAYTTSPILVAISGRVTPPEVNQVFFSYNAARQTVLINGKSYPLNQWIQTPYGLTRFMPNIHQKITNDPGPFFFTVNTPQEVVDGLYSRILITPASKLSSVILLTLTDEVPERGEDILNVLISSYYNSALNNKNSLAKSTLNFVQNRIRTVSKELDSIENRLKDFRNRKGVIDLTEQGKIFLQNVGANDQKTTEIDMQLAVLGEAERYVQNKNDEIGVVPSVSSFKEQPLLAQLLQKLYESEMEYERLRKTVPAGNPNMFSLKNEIDNMRPTILENIRNERNGLIAGRTSITAGNAKYMAMLGAMPGKQKELLDITRQQEIKNTAYSFLLQKREEAEIAYASMLNNMKTINAATASFLPVSPKKTFVLAAAVAFALLAGFGFVLLKESATSKVLFRSDIEKITSIPIAGEIMAIRGKKHFLLSSGNVNELGAIEQFRQLRYALGLNNRSNRIKKILVTSNQSAEGKSFVSNNLALSLTSCNKKVALVDFDFRNPKTSSFYHLGGSKGLSDYFERNDVLVDDIIYPTDNNRLFVIPSGALSSNPTELLLNRDLDELFSVLENEFDVVIMDTAPVDPVVDASIISQYSDSILFVIRHGYSSRSMLESLQKSHKINSMNNMYIVFNGIKPRGFLNKNYGFGYGYGSNKMYGNAMYQLAGAKAMLVNKS